MRWCCVWLVVLGCDSGSATPTDLPPATDADTDTGGFTLPANPTHTTDIQPVWDLRCGSAGGSCHLGGATSGALAMDDAYDNIVSVASDDVPGMALVEPGDPASSYLLHKILDTQGTVGGSGGPMPASGNMTPYERALVEAWIAEGAAR